MNKPLTNKCSSCGGILSAGVKFCGKCGAKVVPVNKVNTTNEIKSKTFDKKTLLQVNKSEQNSSNSNKITEWFWHKGKWESHQVEEKVLNDVKPLNKSKSSYFTWFLIILFVIIFVNIGTIEELINSNSAYVEYEDKEESQSTFKLDELDKITDSEIKPKKVKKSTPKPKKSTPKPKNNNSKTNLKQLAQSHYTQAVDYRYKEKNYTKALSKVSLAISYNKNNWKYYLFRAEIHTLLNNSSKAIDDYNKIIDINPNYAEAYWKKGELYLKKGYYTFACSSFNAAIKKGFNYNSSNSLVQTYKKACNKEDTVDETPNVNILKGVIYKKRGKVLQAAYIQNLTSGKNVFSDRNGKFSIEVNSGDQLRFSKTKLETLTFTVINSTISFHVNNNNIFELTLLKKNSKLGKN